MDDAEIVNIFLKDNLNLHPSVLEKLRKMDDSEIKRILSEVQLFRAENEVITSEYLESLKKKEEQPKKEELREKEVVVLRGGKRVLAEEYEAEIKIETDLDITNKSLSEGDINCFVKYFNDRYEKLSKILKIRDQLRDATSIEWVKEKGTGDIRLIGMVSDIRWSKKGHLILELEDPTGVIAVLVSSKDKELLDLSKSVVKDEVIGIVGKKWNEMIIANEVIFPELPIKRDTNKSEAPLALAMISDIHVGSTKFLEDVFVKFIKWLNGELGSVKHRDLAEKVKYLIIGGDLVDGVGIYPGQDKELVIKDIIQQYGKVADFLAEIPDYIEIIIIPGNHDAVRQAEPQPAIVQEFAPRLYEDPRIHMVGNPCRAVLHGVKVLSYHGRSLDDIISTLPEQSYSSPEKAMFELLRKRHLTPIYGGKVPLAPELSDYMIIDDAPDILHIGHIHHYGWMQYRGVTLINSGTFQDQTSFQRKLNMQPTPGKIPIVDLQEQKTIKMEFM